MSIDDLMEKVADEGLEVQIISKSGQIYRGVANCYTKADDEDGFSTVCVDTVDKGCWCLGENEIQSIEIV